MGFDTSWLIVCNNRDQAIAIAEYMQRLYNKDVSYEGNNMSGYLWCIYHTKEHSFIIGDNRNCECSYAMHWVRQQGVEEMFKDVLIYESDGYNPDTLRSLMTKSGEEFMGHYEKLCDSDDAQDLMDGVRSNKNLPSEIACAVLMYYYNDLDVFNKYMLCELRAQKSTYW